MNLETLRFPVGTYQADLAPTPEKIARDLATLESLPSDVRAAIRGVSTHQLDWVYRPGGWTIRQVIHHLADSHMNSIIRFKLALSEDKPTIKPYLEAIWAEQADHSLDVQYSMDILSGVHTRLTHLLRSLNLELSDPQSELHRKFIHPEMGRAVSLAENIGLYAWHSRHHLAHIHQAIKHQGQF